MILTLSFRKNELIFMHVLHVVFHVVVLSLSLKIEGSYRPSSAG